MRSALAESGLDIGHSVFLAHCPERLHPGSTLAELTGKLALTNEIAGIANSSVSTPRKFWSWPPSTPG